MKLAAELDHVVAQYRPHRDVIERYADDLKRQGGYDDFETRLAWDCFVAIMGTNYICGLYDRYGCTDAHITTLAKRALQQLWEQG